METKVNSKRGRTVRLGTALISRLRPVESPISSGMEILNPIDMKANK